MIAAGPELASGQENLPSSAVASDDDPPHVGLVLSGGAARGFAHVGVIEALEAYGIQIDIVTGTSMGSIIGGLYAIGYSPARLRGVTSDLDWQRVLSDTPERRNLTIERKWEEGRLLFSIPMRGVVPELPTSLIEGQRISQVLTGLTWSVHAESDFTAFPRPFGAVATELETGEAVPLRSGYLPRAIRASLSIPAAFAPVEIDGRLLIDGGLARNLPAQDALDLGADWLICSDVSEPLSSQDSLSNLAEILNQTIAYRMWESTEIQRSLCDVLIVPDVPSSLSTGFDRSEEIIEYGTMAAEAVLDSLIRLGLPVAPDTGIRDRVSARLDPLPGPVRIASIDVVGLERVDRATIDRTLEVEPGDLVSAAEMDRDISRLYDTRLFRSVWYRLTPAAGAAGESDLMDLTVEVRERNRNSLGVSYRYDSRYKASLLLGAGFRNLVFPGSFARGEVRLGEQTRFAAEFGKRWGWSAAPIAALRFDSRRMPFDIFEMGRSVAEPDVSSTLIHGVAGFSFGYSAFVGVEGGFQSLAIDEAPDDRDWLAGDEDFWTVAGVVRVDRWDRARFPRRGWALQGQALWTAGISNDGDFSQQVVDAQGIMPISGQIGILARLTAGATDGDSIPLNYLYFVGGAQQYDLYRDHQFPFYGLGVNEKRGRYLQAATLGLQWEFMSDFFAQVRGNTAALPEQWDWDDDAFFWGWGVTLGAWTRFGSGALTVAGEDFSEWPRVEIDVGFPF
ncbi:MAG: patatin-like phospholipase family protein [marine benthic group bacterium]|nr:patatin-like phospholipase family protein [Gemmatimonadota bacterium]